MSLMWDSLFVSRWTDVADALVSALLAPQCAACFMPLDRPTRGAVCDSCWAQVEASQRPVARPESGPIDRSLSTGRHDGTLRHIIHAFKYEGRRTVARRLGNAMRTSGADVLSGARCVVPVPLHPWRRLARGFNQAEDLAAHLELPIVRALWRKRFTAPQTGLTAHRRRQNVNGAFRMSPLLSRRARRTMLERQVVVLVDDVRTTGATLEACAEVLKAAGVREVRALTIALADSPDQTA